MNNVFRNKKGFFTLVIVLFGMIVFFVLARAVVNSYFKNPFFDKPAEEMFSETGVQSLSSFSILDGIKKELKGIIRQLFPNYNSN